MISRKQRSDSPFILLNIIYRFTFEEQSCGSGIACVPLLYLVRTRAQFLEHFFYKERFKILGLLTSTRMEEAGRTEEAAGPQLFQRVFPNPDP